MKRLPVKYIFPVNSVNKSQFGQVTVAPMQQQVLGANSIQSMNAVAQAASMPVESGVQGRIASRGQDLGRFQADRQYDLNVENLELNKEKLALSEKQHKLSENRLKWEQKRAEIQDKFANLQMISNLSQNIQGMDLLPGDSETAMTEFETVFNEESMKSAIQDPDEMTGLVSQGVVLQSKLLPLAKKKMLYDQHMEAANKVMDRLSTMPADRVALLNEEIGDNLNQYFDAIAGYAEGKISTTQLNNIRGSLGFLFDNEKIDHMTQVKTKAMEAEADLTAAKAEVTTATYDMFKIRQQEYQDKGLSESKAIIKAYNEVMGRGDNSNDKRPHNVESLSNFEYQKNQDYWDAVGRANGIPGSLAAYTAFKNAGNLGSGINGLGGTEQITSEISGVRSLLNNDGTISKKHYEDVSTGYNGNLVIYTEDPQYAHLNGISPTDISESYTDYTDLSNMIFADNIPTKYDDLMTKFENYGKGPDGTGTEKSVAGYKIPDSKKLEDINTIRTNNFAWVWENIAHGTFKHGQSKEIGKFLDDVREGRIPNISLKETKTGDNPRAWFEITIPKGSNNRGGIIDVEKAVETGLYDPQSGWAVASSSTSNPVNTPAIGQVNPSESKDVEMITIDDSVLPTRDGKSFKSKVRKSLVDKSRPVITDFDLVVTDTNDDPIHKSQSQKTGNSFDINFRDRSKNPKKINDVIKKASRSGLRLDYEVATKEERDKIIAQFPELENNIKVVRYITAPHFSVYEINNQPTHKNSDVDAAAIMAKYNYSDTSSAKN